MTDHTDKMHRSTAELEAFLDDILAAPKEAGPIEMIVRRPAEGVREAVDSAVLTTTDGLIGDNWVARVGEDGEPSWKAQLTLMNARVADAVAVARDRWALAGDQVYVDMDLSMTNLPAGSRLRIGEAVIEVSAAPHTGCAKFAGRFGAEALRFANIGLGRENRFRGMNALIIEGGTIAVGDKITKL